MTDSSWQNKTRTKLMDLENSLQTAKMAWADWELNFIKNVIKNLNKELIHISKKEELTLNNLWEKQNFVNSPKGPPDDAA